jgi:rubrerythrin
MSTYRCNHCGYKVKKEKMPECCNYCGKKEGIVEIANAERLLEDLDI